LDVLPVAIRDLLQPADNRKAGTVHGQAAAKLIKRNATTCAKENEIL